MLLKLTEMMDVAAADDDYYYNDGDDGVDTVGIHKATVTSLSTVYTSTHLCFAHRAITTAEDSADSATTL